MLLGVWLFHLPLVQGSGTYRGLLPGVLGWGLALIAMSLLEESSVWGLQARLLLVQLEGFDSVVGWYVRRRFKASDMWEDIQE